MESVCRVCLAIDAPVFVLVGSPLQEVYEKLTNVSLNVVLKPVVACSLCHWQLRKCQKLMTRSLRADKLLTKILQAGAMINRRSISTIDRKISKLEHGLNISPMELNIFLKPEPTIVKEEIKDEPFSYTDENNLENEQKINARDIKLEQPEAIEDVPCYHQALVNNGHIMSEEAEGVKFIKDEIDVEEMNLEAFKKAYDEPVEDGGSTAVKQELQLPTYSEIQDTTALQQNNTRTQETVVEETESSSIARIERPFECVICRKRYKHANNLNIHLRTHTDDKPSECVSIAHCKTKLFECGICQKGYKQKTDYNKHLRTHKEEKLYECATCHREYKHKRSLFTHLRSHLTKNLFECGICQRKFKYKVSLENHLRVHSGEKPFACGICQKSYKQKTDLYKHLRTHSGEKPFECGTCKKRFNQRSTLNIHLRTHNGKKLFECAICHREYKHKTSIIIHLRSHSGEKPFECAICQRRFIRRCDLTVHLRRHTGEKPYECMICKKTFNQRSTLKGHLTTHAKSC